MTNKLLISDANILIDMEVGGLLHDMFKLDCEFVVPDILFYEELEHHHSDLPDLGLLVLELSPECVGNLVQLSTKWQKSRASRNDLSALALAIDKKCPLLTGDKDLRTVCQEEKWKVYGTIWLVEQLLHAEIVTFEQVELAYQAMRDQKRRLPWKTVGTQLEKYKSG